MALKTIAGTMPCMCCDHEIPAKQTEAGGYSVSCPWCDFTAWSKPGTEATRIIAKRVKAAPAEPAPPAPGQVPAPEPKPKAKPFDMWNPNGGKK